MNKKLVLAVLLASLLNSAAYAARVAGFLPITDPNMDHYELGQLIYRDICLGDTPAIAVFTNQVAAGSSFWHPLTVLPWPNDKPHKCNAAPREIKK